MLTGAFPYTPEEIDRIERLGFSADFIQYEKDKLENPEKYCCVVCNGLFLHHALEEFTQLEMIQLTSAGLDRLPMDDVTRRGIQVFNAKDVYHIPMAEWAVLQVLALYKKSGFFYDMQKRRIWEKRRDLLELAGKRVCVVGIGNVGKAIAKRFKCFDAEILGVDVYNAEYEYIDRYFDISGLAQAVEQSDVVVLTLPYTPHTHHLVDLQLLQTFKKGAVLVNLSRGGVIDERALIEVLGAGRFTGVALDVFEEEPLCPANPLWDFENVIVTPHNSFVSDRTRERLFGVIYHNLQMWAGE